MLQVRHKLSTKSRHIWLSGRFGMLEITSKPFKHEDGKYVYYECKCDCGNNTIVQGSSLVIGKTKSCGCYKSQSAAINSRIGAKKRTTHGISKSPLFSTFTGMRSRCYNKKHQAYPSYGGRGIKISDEWLKDPRKFVEWAINNGWRQGLQVDREDNNKDYSSSNCRIVTKLVQQSNKNSNHNITYNGKEKCLTAWCRLLNRNYGTVSGRLFRGWDEIRALQTPTKTGFKGIQNMSNSIVLTFDDSDKREQFVKFLKESNDPIASEAVENHSYSTHKEYSLWVSGQKLIDGDLSEMQKRFQQECASHSASVILKECTNGEWNEIRTRRNQ